MSDTVVDDFSVETSGEHVMAPEVSPDPVVDTSATVDAPEVSADVAASGEAATDGDTETDGETRERDEQGRFKPRHPRDDPKARISQLTAQRHAAERERDALKAELDALRAGKPAAAPAPEPVRPVIQGAFPDFAAWSNQKANEDKSYEEYLEERMEHRLALKAQQSDVQRRAAEFQAASLRVMAQKPELKQAIEATSHIPLTPSLQLAILQSDRGVDIAEYLALHPQEFAQLAAESKDAPPDAAPWMRRFLESKVSAAASPSQTVSAPKPVSTAKPPISTVGSSPVAADPHELSDDLPIEEYIRRANARDRQKRRGL